MATALCNAGKAPASLATIPTVAGSAGKKIRLGTADARKLRFYTGCRRHKMAFYVLVQLSTKLEGNSHFIKNEEKTFMTLNKKIKQLSHS